MEPRKDFESSPAVAFTLIVVMVIVAIGIVGAAVKFGGF